MFILYILLCFMPLCLDADCSSKQKGIDYVNGFASSDNHIIDNAMGSYIYNSIIKKIKPMDALILVVLGSIVCFKIKSYVNLPDEKDDSLDKSKFLSKIIEEKVVETIPEELIEIKSAKIFNDGIQDIIKESKMVNCLVSNKLETKLVFKNDSDEDKLKELFSYCYECSPKNNDKV